MKRSGLLSPSRVERRDALRRIVKRLAADRGLDEAELGAALGISRARFRRMMTFGDLACIAAADVALLGEVLGSHDLLEELERAVGYRRVREVEQPVSTGDVLAGAAASLERGAALVSTVTAALPDGINPLEARAILTRIEETRRALAELEARVASHTTDKRSSR
jgi:hypothetical protein